MIRVPLGVCKVLSIERSMKMIKAWLSKIFELIPRYRKYFRLKQASKLKIKTEVLKMKNRKNSYSIRKLSVGASSIIVASMLFIAALHTRQNRMYKGILKVIQHNHMGQIMKI